MKKTFTLLFTLCIISFSIAKAQSVSISYRPTAKPLYVSSKFYRYNEAYSFTRQDRDFQIAKINGDYNASVNSLMNLSFVTESEKSLIIRNMKARKDARINAVYVRFNDSRNKYNNTYYNDDYSWRGR